MKKGKKKPKPARVEGWTLHKRLRASQLHEPLEAGAVVFTDDGVPDHEATGQREAARLAVVELYEKGRKSAEGTKHAEEVMDAWRDELTKLLTAAVKHFGFRFPGTYFIGEAFAYDKAVRHVLDAPQKEVMRFLEDHPRPGPRVDEVTLSRRTLLAHTAELRHWTRTERDQEWAQDRVKQARADAPALPPAAGGGERRVPVGGVTQEEYRGLVAAHKKKNEEAIEAVRRAEDERECAAGKKRHGHRR